MGNFSYHILRLGLAVTFIWIGVMILRDPAGWAGFLNPWAFELAERVLPFSIGNALKATAILDIALGGLLLFNIFTRVAAFLAAADIAVILITSGIDGVTVRDIGLLGAALALIFFARS